MICRTQIWSYHGSTAVVAFAIVALYTNIAPMNISTAQRGQLQPVELGLRVR